MRSIFHLREFQWALRALGAEAEEMKFLLIVEPFVVYGHKTTNSHHRVRLPSGSIASINILPGKSIMIHCQGLSCAQDERDLKHVINNLGFKILSMEYSHFRCSGVIGLIEPQAIFSTCDALRDNLYKEQCYVCIKGGGRFCFRGRGYNEVLHLLRFIRKRYTALVDPVHFGLA